MSSPTTEAFACLQLSSLVSSVQNSKHHALDGWQAKVLLGAFDSLEAASTGPSSSTQHLLGSAVHDWLAGRCSVTADDLIALTLSCAQLMPAAEWEGAMRNVATICATSAESVSDVAVALCGAVMSGVATPVEYATAPLAEKATVLETCATMMLSRLQSTSCAPSSPKQMSAAALPTASTQTTSLMSCVGQWAFSAAVALRCLRLLAYAHCCCLTGDTIDVFGCVSALQCAHALLRAYGNGLLEWERCAQRDGSHKATASLFSNAITEHPTGHGLTLLALFSQPGRMPVMSMIARAFVVLRARCYVAFSDTIDPLSGMSNDGGGPVDILDASDSTNLLGEGASSRNRMTGTRESPTCAGSRPGTIEGDQRLLNGNATPLISPPSASQAASPSTGPQKVGIAARLFGFVKRSQHTAEAHPPPPSTLAAPPAIKRDATATHHPPLWSLPQAARTLAMWRESCGATVMRVLEECGAPALGDAIAAFQLLRCRPSIHHVTFAVVMDNGTRQGPPRWKQHRFQAHSSHPIHNAWDGNVWLGGTHRAEVAARHTSGMRNWTLCFCTDAASSAASRQSWRLFDSFVFLAADSDAAMLDSANGTRHLFMHRIDGYDQNNTYACLSVDRGHLSTTTGDGNYLEGHLRQDARLLLERFAGQWRQPLEQATSVAV